MDGLEISTDKLDLAAPDREILSLSNFHKVSRAEGPKRTDEMRRYCEGTCLQRVAGDFDALHKVEDCLT